MTVYINVPEIWDCEGCAVNHNAQTERGSFAADICRKLSNEVGGCNDKKCIFIEDTEAARLAYITLKLEK